MLEHDIIQGQLLGYLNMYYHFTFGWFHLLKKPTSVVFTISPLYQMFMCVQEAVKTSTYH